MLALLVQGDAVGRAVAVVLLLMSISSWVVMLRKGWLLRHGTRDVLRSIAAFWQSASLDDAVARLRGFDRTRLVLPSIEALRALVPATGAELGADAAGRATLAATGTADARITRALRDALHEVLRRLHAGQILLATVGATAPFVGLLGTVWGIHRALAGIAHEGTLAIDKVAGPVGEALVMTAAGLAVAIPAVLAYNVLGRVVGRIEAELEGFAHDLLAVFAAPPLPHPPPPPARVFPV